MKKRLMFVFIFLVFCSTAAKAQVNVTIQPESGFLQVDAEIGFDSSITDLSFKIFPSAQLTEIRAENLSGYSVSYDPEFIKIDASFSGSENKQAFDDDDVDKMQTLNISYEGFIYLDDSSLLMDYATLWFPVFSVPIQDPIISVRLPEKWEVISANIMDVTERDSFNITTWKGGSVFTVRQKPLKSSDVKRSHAEIGTEIAPELLSRIQVQVLRLVNSISKRQEEEIMIQLGDDLKDSDLATYLASLPFSYGTVGSKFLSEPGFMEDEFQILLSTDVGREFLATMAWKDYGGKLRLEKFILTPYGSWVPEELRAFLDNFVQRLRYAVETRDFKRIETFLDLEVNRKEIKELILSLNTQNAWSLQYVVAEPLSLTILVPHSDNLRLLLNMGLIPGEDDWLINSFDVVPLN